MANLTSAQRCVLADCTRTALVGWLLSDPVFSEAARRWQYKATTMLGFSFSRFATMAMNIAGAEYRPHSPASPARFPLSVSDVAALANTIEMEMADDDQLLAAGIIACHSPFGHPSVGGRDWRTYISALTSLGLSISDDRPGWRDDVRDRLSAFRQRVAAPSIAAE